MPSGLMAACKGKELLGVAPMLLQISYKIVSFI